MTENKKINGFLYFPAAGLVISCVSGSLNALGIIALFISKFYHNEPVSSWLAIIILTGSFVYLLTLYTATFSFFQKTKKNQIHNDIILPCKYSNKCSFNILFMVNA